MQDPAVHEVRVTGYYPGVLGKIIELHAVYYHRNWAFDLSFEVQEARELADFLGRFRDDRDGLWVANVDGSFAGAIAIDGIQTDGEGARLRWFIVDPNFQGYGIGARLIDQAVAFCRKAGHQRVFLWTFRGLEAARRLYERAGFKLTQQHEVDQWGGVILEQKYELAL